MFLASFGNLGERLVERRGKSRGGARRTVERRLERGFVMFDHETLPGGRGIEAARVAQMAEPTAAGGDMIDFVAIDGLENRDAAIVTRPAQARVSTAEQN